MTLIVIHSGKRMADRKWGTHLNHLHDESYFLRDWSSPVFSLAFASLLIIVSLQVTVIV